MSDGARWIDRAAGIEETAEFFGHGNDRLLGVRHVPLDREPRGGVVVCNSVYNDFMSNGRREVGLARQLASRGLAVQRFHYRGSGDSDGDNLSIRFETMCEDTHAAAARLLEAVGPVPLGFLGTRIGALIAASVARGHPGAPLALIDPVLSGERFFRETWRAPKAHAMRTGHVAPTKEALLDSLETRGWANVIGHTVGRAFHDSTVGLELATELGPGARDVLLLQLGAKTGLRPEITRARADLTSLGCSVETTITEEGPQWWFFQDDEPPPPDLVPDVAAWIERAVSTRQDREPAREATVPLKSAWTSTSSAWPGATTRDERPVYFEVDGETLFGIVTSPVSPSNGTGVVILCGAGWNGSPGRNRHGVRLARALADQGFHTIRFDYRGVGESSGRSRRFALDRPYVSEAAAAADQLRERGLTRLVFEGGCFGARTALAAAAEPEAHDVAGVAMIPLPLRDFAMGEEGIAIPRRALVRRALRPRIVANLLKSEKRAMYRAIIRDRRALSRRRRAVGEAVRYEAVSRRVLTQLAALVEREMPVLLVYGDEDRFYEEFRRATKGPLGDLIRRGGDRVKLVVVPGELHNLASLDVQQHAHEEFRRWVGDSVPPPGVDPGQTAAPPTAPATPPGVPSASSSP